MPKKETAKTELKKEPAKKALKKESAKTVLKKEPAKKVLKKETTKAALKKEPARKVVKKETTKTALKKEPAKTVLKNQQNKPLSKNEEVKISQFEKQFIILLDELAELNKKFEAKAVIDSPNYDPDFVAVKKTGDRLLGALKNGTMLFFNKPTYDTLHHFKRVCKREIAVAEHEYKKHRGLWHRINPVLDGVYSIIAGLSQVPALIDASTSRMGRLKPSYEARHKLGKRNKA